MVAAVEHPTLLSSGALPPGHVLSATPPAAVHTILSAPHTIDTQTGYCQGSIENSAVRVQIFCHCGLQVDLTYSVAKFLVEQGRGNTHAPANPQEEDSLLIYNFHTAFTGKVSSCCEVSMTETACSAVLCQLERMCWTLDCSGSRESLQQCLLCCAGQSQPSGE